MNKRDQQLLDKQFRRLSPSAPNAAVIALTMVAVFIGGIFLGSAVSASEKVPSQAVSNDTVTGIFASLKAPLRP
jgi:hypothetical protein